MAFISKVVVARRLACHEDLSAGAPFLMLMIGTSELAERLYRVWQSHGAPDSWPAWESLPPLARNTWKEVAIEAARVIAEAAGARPSSS